MATRQAASRTQGTDYQARREREKRCRRWVTGVYGMSANGLRAGSGFTVGLFGAAAS
jgi:hypothetical protein